MNLSGSHPFKCYLWVGDLSQGLLREDGETNQVVSF